MMIVGRPSRALVVLAVVVVALLGGAWRAAAHPAPFSYLDLSIDDDRVRGSLVVHIIDAAHDLGLDPPERLLDPAFLALQRARLEALLGPRLGVASDRPLVPVWDGLEPLPERQAIRLTFALTAVQPATLALGPRMFPYDAQHQSFVNVYEAGTLRQQFVFDGVSAPRTYFAGTTLGVLAVVTTFVPSGVHHILIGPDHILFLVGLLLLGGGLPALVRIVTAFTIGHSLTLTLAALDLLAPPARVIEPAIALSIVFVGTDNLLRGAGRDLRTWIALTFGLVHGFGFANVLREFGLPREALGWSLFSFNVGVEIGQLGIVLVVASALAFVRRRDPALAARVATAGSVVVMLAGSYWFVVRLLFPAGA